MVPPRLYIFDMGGVVCGSVHCAPAMAAFLGLTQAEFFSAAGADRDAPYYSGDVRSIQDGSMDAEDFWSAFEARAARLFPRRGIALPRRGDGRFEDLWGRFFFPVRDEGVIAAIDGLIARGRRVVCGTNTLPVHFEIHSARGDYGRFAAVYASHLMGTAKPDAEFWRRILAAEGVGAKEAFFVDDTEANAAAAADLGFVAHRFVDAAALRADLASLGAFRS